MNKKRNRRMPPIPKGKPRRAPTVTLQEYMTQRIADIAAFFPFPTAVTIVVRAGEHPEEQMVMGSDDILQVIKALETKRDAFIASQRADAEARNVPMPPTVDDPAAAGEESPL